MTRQPRLHGVEMLRGIACLLIVMRHADSILGEPRYNGVGPFHTVFGEFQVGVDFFFVLSGFIIAWVHWDDIGNKSRLRHYTARRFTRIFPAYWAILIPLTLLYHAFPASGTPDQHQWSNFLTSFFLVPASKEQILGVAWTLVYEVYFYAVFGALIFMGKKYLWLLPVWGAGILLFPLSGIHDYYANFLFNAYNLNFLIGIGAALLLRTRKIPRAELVLLIGGGIFLTAMFGRAGLFLIDYSLAARLLFGLSAGLTLVGIVELERSGKFTLHPRLQILGAASYSIYLVHPVALSFMLLATWPFVKTVPAEIICWFLIAAGVIAGIAYHKAVEMPVISFVRKFFP